MPEPDSLANEGWFNNRWRPFMAWTYAATVIADFLIYPAFQTVWYGPNQYHEYHPITLQGGGFYHVAMGAIIGVAVWQRTQEKLAIYKSDYPDSGTITTERTTEKTSSTPPTMPTKVDIKTDTVQVNNSNSRAD